MAAMAGVAQQTQLVSTGILIAQKLQLYLALMVTKRSKVSHCISLIGLV